MSNPFPTLAAAIPYGWSLNYHLMVEGIPTIFCERVYDQVAPTNYTLDGSLIIENGAALGSQVDRAGGDNIGRGYDLSVRFLSQPGKLTGSSDEGLV